MGNVCTQSYVQDDVDDESISEEQRAYHEALGAVRLVPRDPIRLRDLLQLPSSIYSNARLLWNDAKLVQQNQKDKVFMQAFDNTSGISKECRNEISKIKGGSSTCTSFYLRESDASHFTNDAWKLLGNYLANSNVLKCVNFNQAHMNTSRMTPLFRELTKSDSIKSLSMYSTQWEPNSFDYKDHMIPFLQNSNLLFLNLYGNSISTDGFELLVKTLEGGSIKELRLDQCDIGSISALEDCTLPDLEELHLSRNNITTIPSLNNHKRLYMLDLDYNKISKPKLLHSEGLKSLSLSGNNIEDDGIDELANSLKHNTSLTELKLMNNKLSDMGLCPLLKLLNDVSSIGSTINSNHVLTSIRSFAFSDIRDKTDTPTKKEVRKLIKDATRINSKSSNPGRDKIIQTQLNSTKRHKLAHLEGVSAESLLSEDESFILPEILSLVAETQGQNELYHMIVEVVPYLM